MKMAFIALRRWLAALAPGHWRDTVNRHPRIVNLIAIIVIFLVVVDVGRQLGLPGKLFTVQHSFASRPKPLKFLNVRNLHCPAQFVTAMVSDGHGGAYVASEDSGIYHYLPGSAWQHYDKANSPGLISNHIYSLCLDAKGRLWAGTLRHGVCVYNGQTWRHYGLLNGPLGCHVVAITSNPYDRSVWMCTEAGISIYETGKHKWRYLPQATPEKTDDISADGLPPNPDCVAFNTDGVAFVGTQCNGLAIGYPPYRSWWMVKGPWKMPITPFGKGLPSNLINAVVAGKHGRIYVATDEGLAWDNPGDPYVFQYERGRDYAAKVKGLWRPPARFKMPSRAFLNHLLPGDHVTCLAVDHLGELWLGTWRNGMWIDTLNHRVPRQGQIRELTPGVRRFSGALLARRRWWVRSIQLKKSGVHDITSVIGPQPPAPNISRFVLNMFYVSAILPLADGQVLLGHYGCGVTVGRLVPQTLLGRIVGTADRWVSDLEPGPFWHANLPAPAKAPTSRQLETLYENLLENNIPQKSDGPRVIPITDDWRTQGSWLGRYGRYWACLFACCSSPPDYVWSPASITLDHFEQIGPHHAKRDSVRYWVQWLATTKNRVLELPEIYLDSRVLMHLTNWDVDRRESEIDDHGEAYPTTWQGPDLYVYLHIPPGAYTLSLYFFNKDGHSQEDRNRDYVVSMLPLAASHHFGKLFSLDTAPLARMHGTAQAQVVNFWGGLWKRFLVRGPMKLAIRVAKNCSFDTILQAAMLDPLSQHPAPYYYGHSAWQAHEKRRWNFRTKLVAAWQSGQLSDDPPTRTGDGGLATARRIIQILNVVEHRDLAVWAANQRFAYGSILRWCLAKYGANLPTSHAAVIAEKCYYRLSLFRRWEALEKSQGITTSRQIEKGLRWDRWRDSFRGLEFRTIRGYVKRLKADRDLPAAN